MDKKPFDKIETRHLNTKNRAAQKFEQSTNFQIETDLASFKLELNREKQVIYLCERGQKMMKQATVTKKLTEDQSIKYLTYNQIHS